jgi:winged helix-turn-helix protein
MSLERHFSRICTSLRISWALRPCGPARNYLEREWGIGYKNGKEHGWLFKKHRVKWKTGRRRHKKANAGQQAAFKKPLAP